MQPQKSEKKFKTVTYCPIRQVLDRLGDKWSILVLVTLHANGVMRFSDLRRTIEDISERMLTVTLRSLESDGLISRRVYPQVPPRVEYDLTAMGRGLMPHMMGLVEWAEQQMPAIIDHRGEDCCG